MAARLLSGGVWSLLGYATVAVTGLGVNAVLARLLSPEEVGAYFLALSISVVGALFAQFGTQLSVVRLVARELAQNRFSEVRQLLKGMGLLVVTGLVVVEGVYLAGGGAWLGGSVFHSPFVAGASFMISLWLALRVCQTLFAQTLRGFHDIKFASLLDGAMSNVLLLMLLLGVWMLYGRASFTIVLNLTVIAFAFSVALGPLLLSRHWRTLPPAPGLRLRSVFHVSLPLFVSSVSMLGIGELHLWILGAVGSEQQVALYGAAYRLIQLVAIPLVLVSNVISPSVTALFAQRDLTRLERVMRTTATAAAVPALLVAVTLVFAAGPVLVLLYGDFYAQAASALIIMTVAQVINVLTGSPGILLAMSDRQTVLMRIGMLAGLCGLVMSLLLAGFLGATGVAIGLATGMIAHNVAMCLYCRWRLGVKTHGAISQIPELIWRLRTELAQRAHLSSLWLVAERMLRPIENVIYRFGGTRVVECFGDSHVGVFSTLNRKRCMRGWHFRGTIVRGATAFGMANPNSKTNAYKIFSGWLARLPPNQVTLFMLGEVDVGYLIWMKAKQTGEDPYNLLEQALSRYFWFLERHASHLHKLVLVSALLPAAGDDHNDPAMLNLRKGLTASQRERTDLTLEYNRRLRVWAQAKGVYFIDMDEALLDPETRLLRAEYVHKNRVDHHYVQETFSQLLCVLLSSGEFCRWAEVRNRPGADLQR
jgi:O-antigen/teichoic acid export membrane protein